MAYGDFKDLTKRTASDKILRVKTFNIAKNAKYDGYQRRLALMIDNFFDKKLLPLVKINLLVVVLKIKISQTNT